MSCRWFLHNLIGRRPRPGYRITEAAGGGSARPNSTRRRLDSAQRAEEAERRASGSRAPHTPPRSISGKPCPVDWNCTPTERTLHCCRDACAGPQSGCADRALGEKKRDNVASLRFILVVLRWARCGRWAVGARVRAELWNHVHVAV